MYIALQKLIATILLYLYYKQYNIGLLFLVLGGMMEWGEGQQTTIMVFH